jgi:hypothetical protein
LAGDDANVMIAISPSSRPVKIVADDRRDAG